MAAVIKAAIAVTEVGVDQEFVATGVAEEDGDHTETRLNKCKVRLVSV